MKTKFTSFPTQSKRPYFIISGILLLLMVPAVAMEFTDEVQWTSLDFIVAAILLSATGFAFEIISRKIKGKYLKILAIACLFITLGLLWAELAVGIFGSPIA